MSEVATARVTHQVRNQAAPATGFNAFDDDAACADWSPSDAPWAKDKVLRTRRPRRRRNDAGGRAPRQPPRARAEDPRPLRQPHRLGRVPSGVARADGAGVRQHEVHSLAWTAEQAQPHFARAVLAYIWNQVEHGVGCPTGMAYAAYAGLRASRSSRLWQRRRCGTQYDQPALPSTDKTAAVIGYAMTEKQGGSDLRETQTTARSSPQTHGARAQCVSRSPATSGSARCRSPTASSRWRRVAGRRDAASSCRACCPTAAATASSSSA